MRAKPVILAAVLGVSSTLPALSLAHTEPDSLSLFFPYTQMANLPWRAGLGLAGHVHFHRFSLEGSYRHQFGYGQRTGYAYLDNIPVLQNVVNLRAGYTVFNNCWLRITPFVAYNYLAYGDLRNNGIGIGLGAHIKPVSWLTLYGHAEALEGFDGNIAGSNLTRPANLYQLKGGAAVPVTDGFSLFTALEFNRYIGRNNTLTGYTIEAGVKKTF